MQKHRIHRHTGGLESCNSIQHTSLDIHRHTGGLEITSLVSGMGNVIHRHTGGLEKKRLSETGGI